MSGDVRHLYVHLPFCAHHCGYCDFVTVVGRREEHGAYVDGLLGELELERHVLATRPETIFLGGGTPTFTDPEQLARLLDALPAADEVTVEANPESVTPTLARLLCSRGVNRISLGAQSFRRELLEVLHRRAQPEDVRRAFYHLRDANFDNVSLDLLYGVPGETAADLDRDLREALALGPEHMSCYELEAKPGTRFAHEHGEELSRQADAMESHFEQVVETLTSCGYRWYETANFCVTAERAHGRDLRAQHNLAYWVGRDYLGIGVGAVSTIHGKRRTNTARLRVYLDALVRGQRPPREVEELDEATRSRERVMLGLRLDEPLRLPPLANALDEEAITRLGRLGLLRRAKANGAEHLMLTRRGRFLGGAVTAELLA